MGREKTKNIIIGVFVITFSLLFFVQLPASTGGPLWGDLQPGPYEVGFKAVEKYDYTRTFGAKSDYFGNLIEGNRTRQLQICVWYPAVVDPEAQVMIYGEYSYVYPENEEFIAILAQLNNREIQQLFGITGGNRGYVVDFMNIPMAAIKDAPAKAGSFPKLIYIPHFESSFCANAVLCEYLASHGFIVATTHPVGTVDINPGLNPADIETAARDAEFVIGYLNDFPYAASDKTALIGFGSGGISAQLLQMRNSDIDAIVSLGGSYTFENFLDLFRQGDYFDPEKMLVPLMHMYPGVEHKAEFSLVDSLPYATRYSCRFDKLDYFDFSQAGAIVSMMPDSTGAQNEPNNRGYQTVCLYSLNFLKAMLLGDEAGKIFIDHPPTENGLDPDFLTIAIREKSQPPPTSDQFVRIATETGAAAAAEIYDKFKTSHPGRIEISEANFNMLGYRLMQQGQVEDSKIILRLNAEAHPNSANCWDSYSDACQAAGDTETAKSCYKKVLEILSGDQNMDNDLRATLQTNAEEGLIRLENDTEN